MVGMPRVYHYPAHRVNTTPEADRGLKSEKPSFSVTRYKDTPLYQDQIASVRVTEPVAAESTQSSRLPYTTSYPVFDGA